MSSGVLGERGPGDTRDHQAEQKLRSHGAHWSGQTTRGLRIPTLASLARDSVVSGHGTPMYAGPTGAPDQLYLTEG